MSTTIEKRDQEILYDFWEKNPETPKNPIHHDWGKPHVNAKLKHISAGTGIPYDKLLKLQNKGRNYTPETGEEWEHYTKMYRFLMFERMGKLPTELIEGPPD